MKGWFHATFEYSNFNSDNPTIRQLSILVFKVSDCYLDPISYERLTPFRFYRELCHIHIKCKYSCTQTI